MGGINIDWNPGADRKYREALAYRQQKDEEEKRQKREDDARALFTQLLDKGAQPDVAEQAASRFLQTGRIDLPEFQTKNLPGTNMFPEGIPVREPMALRNKKGLFSLDQASGKYQQEPLPSDIDSVSVNTFNSSNGGYDIYVDAATGQEVRREPNGSKANRTIKVGSTGGAEAPDVAVAKDTFKKGQAMKAKGEEMTPEFQSEWESAAEMLGVPVTREKLDPTLIDQAINYGSKLTRGRIDKAPQRYGEPTADFNKSSDAKRKRAMDWLRSKEAKVTDANIDATIKAGKVK